LHGLPARRSRKPRWTIVDTSAIIAVLFNEDDAQGYAEAITLGRAGRRCARPLGIQSRFAFVARKAWVRADSRMHEIQRSVISGQMEVRPEGVPIGPFYVTLFRNDYRDPVPRRQPA